MTNKNIVIIHGKEYMTVAGRIELAHEKCAKLNIQTEIVSAQPLIVKATVTTDKGSFTGHSGSYEKGIIEKSSPLEVCETSAVGRALGLAGFGLIEGVATADEVIKANEPSSELDEIDKALNGAADTVSEADLVIKVSNSANNPGRKYRYNTKTREFAGWVTDTNSNVTTL